MSGDQFRAAITAFCVRSVISSAVCRQIAHVLALACGWNALVALWKRPKLGRSSRAVWWQWVAPDDQEQKTSFGAEKR
jgi:hypothetical protein